MIRSQDSGHRIFVSQRSQGYQILPDTSQYPPESIPQYTPKSTQPHQPSSGVMRSAPPHPSTDDFSNPLPTAPLHPSATNHTASFYGSTQPPPYESAVEPPHNSQHTSPGEPSKKSESSTAL